MNMPDPRIAPPASTPAADARCRALYRTALGATSAPTLARLRQARQAATAPGHARHGWRWALAGVPALLALALGLHPALHPPTAPVPAPAAAATAATAPAGEDDPGALLEENPDLYVWLDAHPALAME